MILLICQRNCPNILFLLQAIHLHQNREFWFGFLHGDQDIMANIFFPLKTYQRAFDDSKELRN